MDALHKELFFWRFGPLDNAVEAAALYKVEVTFGDAPVTVKAGFDLTIQPSSHDG